MKDSPSKSPPFLRRRWFEEHEFDDIAKEALKRHGLLPKEPAPIEIELFVDMEFGFSYEFMDLGEDCLGLIYIGEKGPEKLFIHTKLDAPEDPVVNRRCRSTLAHECGHGLLHTDLFVELWEHKKRTNSFEDSRRLITWRERGENIEGNLTKTSPQWWEYQADRMISALLLPLNPLRAALRGWGHDLLEIKTNGAWQDPALHALVRDTFDVSLMVARIRLERLYGREYDGCGCAAGVGRLGHTPYLSVSMGASAHCATSFFRSADRREDYRGDFYPAWIAASPNAAFSKFALRFWNQYSMTS